MPPMTVKNTKNAIQPKLSITSADINGIIAALIQARALSIRELLPVSIKPLIFSGRYASKTFMTALIKNKINTGIMIPKIKLKSYKKIIKLITTVAKIKKGIKTAK